MRVRLRTPPARSPVTRRRAVPISGAPWACPSTGKPSRTTSTTRFSERLAGEPGGAARRCWPARASAGGRAPSARSWSCSWWTRRAPAAGEPAGAGADGGPAGDAGDRPLQPGAQPAPGAAGGPALHRAARGVEDALARGAARGGHAGRAAWSSSASCPRCARRTWARGALTRHAALPGALRGHPPATARAPFQVAIAGEDTLTLDVGRRDAGGRQHLAPVPPAGGARGRSRACTTRRSWPRRRCWRWPATRRFFLGRAAVGRDAGGALPPGGGRPRRAARRTGLRRTRGCPSATAGCARARCELFAEAVALHPPLLPVVGRGVPAGVRWRAAALPGLDELRLHQSTVWSWNRAGLRPGGRRPPAHRAARAAGGADGGGHGGQRRVPAGADAGAGGAGGRAAAGRCPSCIAREQLPPGGAAEAWTRCCCGPRRPRPSPRPVPLAGAGAAAAATGGGGGW